MGTHIDFDELRRLADGDPQAFEQQRKAVIAEAIARAPARRRERLRGLQWRIEQVRSRAANPMDACISLSGMMWEAFSGDEGLCDQLNRPLGKRPRERERAPVVPLR